MTGNVYKFGFKSKGLFGFCESGMKNMNIISKAMKLGIWCIHLCFNFVIVSYKSMIDWIGMWIIHSSWDWMYWGEWTDWACMHACIWFFIGMYVYDYACLCRVRNRVCIWLQQVCVRLVLPLFYVVIEK